MNAVPVCPRCGGSLRGPSAWSSSWQCDQHGEVHPLRTVSSLRGLSAPGFRVLLQDAAVPVWLPWPLPPAWLVTGLARAGDERSGSRGCALAVSGPGPVGGLAEMLLISEEPGVGMGARYAGLPGPDAGTGAAAGPPDGSVRFGNHEFPVWHVDAPDRAAFIGEVMGSWLWLILWPDTAGMLLVEPLVLRDLRDPGFALDLPFGAPSPLLSG